MPGIGTLHHPAFLKRCESAGRFRTYLDFDVPRWAMLGHPRLEAMVMILVISKDRFEPWKVLRLNQLEQLGGYYTIIQRCAGDQQHKHQPQSIDQEMPFAAVNLLAPIIATLGTANLRRLDRLAVDTHSTRRGLPACTGTSLFSQHLQDL